MSLNYPSLFSKLRQLATEPMTVTVKTPTQTTIFAVKPTCKWEPLLTAKAGHIALGALGVCGGVALAYVGYKTMGGFDVTRLDLNPPKSPPQWGKLPTQPMRDPLLSLNNFKELNMCPRELDFAKLPPIPLRPLRETFTKQQKAFSKPELEIKPKSEQEEGTKKESESKTLKSTKQIYHNDSFCDLNQEPILFSKSKLAAFKFEPDDFQEKVAPDSSELTHPSEPELKNEVPKKETNWNDSFHAFEDKQDKVFLTKESKLAAFKFEPDDFQDKVEKHVQYEFKFEEPLNKAQDYKNPVTMAQDASNEGYNYVSMLTNAGLGLTALGVCGYALHILNSMFQSDKHAKDLKKINSEPASVLTLSTREAELTTGNNTNGPTPSSPMRERSSDTTAPLQDPVFPVSESSDTNANTNAGGLEVKAESEQPEEKSVDGQHSSLDLEESPNPTEPLEDQELSENGSAVGNTNDQRPSNQTRDGSSSPSAVSEDWDSSVNESSDTNANTNADELKVKDVTEKVEGEPVGMTFFEGSKDPLQSASSMNAQTSNAVTNSPKQKIENEAKWELFKSCSPNAKQHKSLSDRSNVTAKTIEEANKKRDARSGSPTRSSLKFHGNEGGSNSIVMRPPRYNSQYEGEIFDDENGIDESKASTQKGILSENDLKENFADDLIENMKKNKLLEDYKKVNKTIEVYVKDVRSDILQVLKSKSSDRNIQLKTNVFGEFPIDALQPWLNAELKTYIKKQPSISTTRF